MTNNPLATELETQIHLNSQLQAENDHFREVVKRLKERLGEKVSNDNATQRSPRFSPGDLVFVVVVAKPPQVFRELRLAKIFGAPTWVEKSQTYQYQLRVDSNPLHTGKTLSSGANWGNIEWRFAEDVFTIHQGIAKMQELFKQREELIVDELNKIRNAPIRYDKQLHFELFEAYANINHPEEPTS